MTRVRLRVRALLAALTALLVVLSGMTMLAAEPAQAAPVSINCAPGTAYSVSSDGQMWKITSGGTSKVGDPARDVTGFNGLGIGDDGKTVYALNRLFVQNGSDSGVTVYRLTTGTGTWSSVSRQRSVSGISLIAGAVDPLTGSYYFGGYSTDGKSFSLYVFDPSTDSITLKATVDTSSNYNSASNGDMAFDASGNLFIVRGVGTKTTVFSLSKAALDKGNNLSLKPSVSGPFDTSDKVNGVAFDANGTAYLGSSDDVKAFDMPGWSNGTNFSTSSGKGTDLASCSPPPSVTLMKNIQGRRAKAGDQFELTLKEGSTGLGKAVTTGDDADLQDDDEEVVRVATKPGAELTLSEAGVGATDLADYESSYSCSIKGTTTILSEGNRATGTVTIPRTGKEIVCTITNAPLTANVSIHKDVVDENGENKKPGKDWAVGAKATATSDTVSSNPTATTQKTDANGDAKWGLKFSKTTGRATVAVSETQQDGYEFKSGSCDITRLDGSKATTKLTSDKSTDLTGIKPGDDVKCSYLNKVKDTTLTLVKKVDNTAAAGTAKDTDWTLKAEGDAASGNKTIEGKTGSESVTKAKVKSGKYALSEAGTPKGYEASDWDCKPRTGSGVVTSDKSSVTLKSGDDATCTITNTAKTGAVTWGKTDESGNALKGSVWTLTDPDGKSTEIEDCVAASADKCAGADKDPAAGKFSVDRLKWGKHTLVEKKAPAGYILDDAPHTFTVSGPDLEKKLGSYTNEQKPPVALPLTGGTGSQIYLIGGAALLAAAGAIALLKGLRRRNRKH
ncbi:SpaA isopeptide-forming pilin-related protein [Brevibacterium oceani]|uniref:SpaA isopeptide-forming pilin-related protein n=1 Tax=Brevibacterium oceani TaxID=358099 RepID=UPI001B31E5EC|nr:SpaA isopeptide-forming pilin-related protein [Brevibacterium oceani]